MFKPRAYFNQEFNYWVISIHDYAGYKAAAHYDFWVAFFEFKNKSRVAE